MTSQYILADLHCANCAAKIEDAFVNSPYCKEVILDFTNKKLSLTFENAEDQKNMNDVEVANIVHQFEPSVGVSRFFDGDDIDIEESSTKTYKKYTLSIGLALFAVAMFLSHFKHIHGTAKIAIFFGIYILVGHDVLKKSILGIKNGQWLDENFLMSIATIGAITLNEWPEAVAVMMFYEIGEAFQDKAVNKSRRSIKALLNIKPDTVTLPNGTIVTPKEVLIGTHILVKPGEKIPLDGIVVSGNSNIDTSALTGESMPRHIEEGKEVLSGSVNIDGTLTIKVTKPFGESTVFKILELVEKSATKKSKTERFITKFARYYTPTVVFSAIALSIIPPIIFHEHFSMWFNRALIFLVVSCPCALVVSIPLGYFGGIGAASKKGILIKGGQYLDALESIDTIAFDKTGTLTTGTFNITNIYTADAQSENEILKLAYLAENHSNHPIALSIKKEAKARNIQISPLEHIREIAGQGISTNIDNKPLLVGNARLMEKYNIKLELNNPAIKIDYDKPHGTFIYISLDGKLNGIIEIADLPKEGVNQTLKKLKSIGIKYTQMLTGDCNNAAELAFEQIDIDSFKAELLPEDKVNAIDSLIKEGKKTAFIGDGVNDAPVLAMADVGIAMGALGSDAAIEAADVVLMTDELSKIPEAIHISKFTRKIILENIIMALGVKLAVMVLGAIGIATMWMAVFADVGVAVLAIFNAMRILKA